MADLLSLQQGGGPIGTAVTPQQPVTSQAIPTVLNSVGNLVRGAFDAFGEAAKLEQKKQEKVEELAGAKVVSEFASAQLKIANAVEQGMSLSKARTLMRQNFDTYQSNNPLLAKELTDTHKSIISTQGLGKVVDEGTEQQQLFAAAQKEAHANGWGDTELAVQNYLQFKRAQQEGQALQQKLTYQNSLLENEGKLTSNKAAALSLEEKTIQKEQQYVVGKLGDAYHYKFRSSTDAIVAKFRDGQLPPDQALAMLNGEWQTIQSTIMSSGRQTSSEYLSNITAPMKMSYENAKEVIQGKQTLEAYENQSNLNVAMQKLNITGDPQTARIVATTELLRNADYLIAKDINTTVTKILGGLSTVGSDTPNPYTKDDAQDFGTALNVVKQNMKAYSNGTLKGENAQAQLFNSMEEVMRGVNIYAQSVDNPKQAQTVVDFFASPEVALMIKKSGGLPTASAKAAHETLMQTYEQQVMPLIQAEFDKAQLPTGKFKSTGKGVLGGSLDTAPITSVIEPVFMGSGVVFRPIAGVDNADNLNVKLKDLNTKVSPILDKLVRMSAHLEGTVDYKGVFEKNYSGFFLPKEEPKKVGE